MSRLVLSWLLAAALIGCGEARNLEQNEDEFAALRARMVAVDLAARDISDPAVLSAMRTVPRHLFVPEGVRRYAYADSPLPIGLEQTISQPYIVALMTQLAAGRPGHRALEVGTGSGYQAAVLSLIVDQVFSIEIIPELAERSASTLRDLGYSKVTVRQGDGYEGWPEEAPFDIILVTAAAPRVPQPLIEQLKDGGRMVIPVGPPGAVQELLLFRKEGKKIKKEIVIPVRFVPMTGQVQSP